METTTTTRLAEIADHLEAHGHVRPTWWFGGGPAMETSSASVLGAWYLTHPHRNISLLYLVQVRHLEAMWLHDWQNGDDAVWLLAEIAAADIGWDTPTDALDAWDAVNEWSYSHSAEHLISRLRNAGGVGG